METNQRQKMTNDQKRSFHAMLSVLGYENTDKIKVVQKFSNGKYSHCSDMDYIDAQTMLREMRTLLARSNRPKHLNSDQKKLDKLRKGCIRAVFAWVEIRGQKASMEYVKGIICRAAQRNNINELTESELTRVYNEFCRKQSVLLTAKKNDYIIYNN